MERLKKENKTRGILKQKTKPILTTDGDMIHEESSQAGNDWTPAISNFASPKPFKSSMPISPLVTTTSIFKPVKTAK